MIKMDTCNKFVWGAATAAYQIEGAWLEDGKGPSIWDAWSQIPGKIDSGDTGNTACDHYHKWEEDVEIMRNMGLKAYRFSISWSRLFPNGRGKVNEKGVQFYNKLINKLVEYNIQPWVTLYHWDLPLVLQLEYGGWESDKIVEDFNMYAKFCFDTFGDRVQHWVTINEPFVVAYYGYGTDTAPPGRNSQEAAFKAGHNLLLSHAKVYKTYVDNYKDKQKGQVGIVLNSSWKPPHNKEDIKDVEASQRIMDFKLGWFAGPLFEGEYPQTLKSLAYEMLPEFTEIQRNNLKNSLDFLGINHYSTKPVTYGAKTNETDWLDILVNVQNTPIQADKNCIGWPVVPIGIRELMKYIKYTYPNYKCIYITENGYADKDTPNYIDIHDHKRVQYLKEYIEQVQYAIKDGVNIKGYFVWSFLDNMEWCMGYTPRFGIVRVDYNSHDKKRILKDSGKWYTEWIQQQDSS